VNNQDDGLRLIVVGYRDGKARFWLTSGSTYTEDRKKAKHYMSREACWNDITEMSRYHMARGIEWQIDIARVMTVAERRADLKFQFWLIVSTLALAVLCLGAVYLISIAAAG